MRSTIIIGAEDPAPPSPVHRLLAYGGDPGGRDSVHEIISRWRGWRRRPAPANHPELGPVSVYHAHAYPSTLIDLETAELNLLWTPLARRVAEQALTQAQEVAHALRQPHPPSQVTQHRTPMPHQMQAIRAARAMRYRVLLADDMGLGKTASALWIAEDCLTTRVLVICPVSVKRNWIREIELAFRSSWTTLLIDGTRRHRADQFAELEDMRRLKTPVAVICNYDLLIQLAEQQLLQLTEFVRDGLIICDESHALKTRTAQRTRLVREIAATARHRLLLSGTPIRNTVEDIYSQIEIVQPGTWSSFSDFAKRHLKIQRVTFGKKTVQKTVGARNIDELNRVVNTLQIRRKKEDVLTLPPKTHTFPELELDEVSARVYRVMKDFAVLRLAELAPQTSVFDPKAHSAVEAAMRCEQIAQGFVGGIPEPLLDQLSAKVLKHAVSIPGRRNELLFPHAPKLVWLLETIDSIRAQGGKPVVFSRFNAPMAWLSAKLQKEDVRVSWLHGGLTSEEKDNAIAAFQKGETEVFLCQVKMAEGFNLVQSQDVIFLGRDWSPAVNSQAEDRCHRIGQRGTVNIQVPIVLKTVEWPIHKRLIAKAQDAESALKSFTVAQLKEEL